MIVIEGIAFCFWLLFICVSGIAEGPHGLVVFYEKDVQERCIQLGLTTSEKIRKTAIVTGIALFVPLFTVLPYIVYRVNGAGSFAEGFRQMTAILLIMGLFDRVFIDWYWVGHTKAWIIPGTEDLMPYIPLKTMAGKWAGTLIGFPLMAALIAKVIELFF